MNDSMKRFPEVIKKGRGLMNPVKVRWATFITISLCILVSAVTCIFAIWDFTQDDTLWRTVSTCIVVAGTMMAFGVVNAFYGARAEGV